MLFPFCGRKLAVSTYSAAMRPSQPRPALRVGALVRRGAALPALLIGLALGSAVAVAGDGRGAVLVVDANSGHTLHASAADEPRHPASLTKMMTLYMVFDLIERGRLSYKTPIRISANAAGAAPSKLDLKEGEEIALIDAIRVLITKSANDVAIAVAENIGGTEANFARLMTQRAHAIGMAGTTFRNASGLPDPQQVTTARDMATLALRLQDEFPQHYVLFGTRTFTYRGETFRNHNTLLFHYEGADGIKTGYTRASGFNLVSSVRRGNKHVVGVVFGGASAASRDTAMRTYLNIGLVKASSVRTRPSTPQLLARTASQDRIASVPTPQKIGEGRRPDAPPQARPGPWPLEATAAPTATGLTMVRVRPMPMPAQQPTGRYAPAETASIESLLSPASATPSDPRSSTLEAQAQRLGQGLPPVVQRTAATPSPTPAPAPRQPAAARGPSSRATGAIAHVQIGAFPSAQEAERQLAATRSRVSQLAQARLLTQAVQQGDKTLYRARYAGLEPAAAAQACDELKKQGVACLVFKGE